MIKLNNKNITYVALADSNNSLKAPKEIWYADSNNSVKLVYRRKDALIEGEDYEKYHWLEGRSGAYINTNHKLVTIDDAFEFHAHYDKTLRNELNQEQEVFGFATGRNNRIDNLLVRVYIYTSNGFNGNYFWHEADSSNWGGKDYGVNMDGDAVIKLSADENHYYVSYDNVQTTNTFQLERDTYGDIYLFNSNDGRFTGHFNGGISYFRITDPTFTTDKLHFIPCKLLKPLPKWLDANGIRRQVGECGMIDLVSGKFYGNVNSVGTFTVENYYERKEWLIADIPISTNMMTLPVNSDTLYFKRIWKSFGNSSYFLTDKYDYYTYFYQKKVSIYDSIGSDILGHFGSTINVDEVIEVDSNNERMIMHNVEVPKYGFPITSMHLNNGSNGVDSVTHYTSVISVNGIERYIPCTLTMDLPASMDANNIARTKGTSGMWDLVSDRFYGNVASSGTFKAVNLAEGVDYEVHQWLITENSGGALMMSLPLNTYDFSLKRRILELDGNCYHFLEQGGTLQYFTTVTLLRVYENGVPTFSSIAQVSFGDDIEIKSTNNSFTFNGEAVPIPDSYFTYLRFKKSVSGTNMKISTSSITVDGIERYIPVKLLKSIPSKYDANGIARQAGECGMYDTVNDVFYGNVASSGTFSVSDD